MTDSKDIGTDNNNEIESDFDDNNPNIPDRNINNHNNHNNFQPLDSDSASQTPSTPSENTDSIAPEFNEDPMGGESEAEIMLKIQQLQRQLEALRADPHGDDSDQDQDSVPGSNSAHDSDSHSASPHSPRLIVVSNRLPVTVSKQESGDWKFRVSSGGLVSALAGVKNKIPFIWVGWTGDVVAQSDQELMKARFLDEMNCYPVFLTEDDADLYYNGFCNNILWPLFHYVPLPIISTGGERKFDAKYWHAYSRCNHRFADAVMQVYQPGDLVWVQDYHLMLLPSLLRKRLPDVTIGFFLHTPFPSSEVYRILPVRNKVLQGVLAADLIGFHTYDYAFHFLSVCTRMLGLESSPKGVKFKDHFAFVDTFPIGTDPNSFLNNLQRPNVKEGIADLKNKFRGKKIVLGVDRLDYTKGVPHKLMAFENLLANQPQWKNNVVLIQIGVPTRTEVDEYKKLISQTNELVGRINGQYGSVERGPPILFFNKPINFDDLCALYAVADVLLVTPLRDGMNLVSYEYVVCQHERHGVLVLSEFAGSAQSLSSAIRVNPWNIEELANALHEALTLPASERKLKHQRLFQYVKKHNAAFWAHSFVKHLRQIDTSKAQDIHRPMQSLLRVPSDVLPEMRVRRKRLFLIEYEGILVPSLTLAELAYPPEAIRQFLESLASEPENYVYIVSGRSKEVLTKWFDGLNVGLICENGCDYIHPGAIEWQTVVEASIEPWMDSVMPILLYFKERTPGAHIDVKAKTITWHFQDADQIFGSWQAKELQLLLAESCVSLPPVEVISGPEYLELRPRNLSRVPAVQRIISERSDGIDFAFAIGSDKVDEDVFAFFSRLSQNAEGHIFTLTCRVGEKSDNSSADRYVPDPEVVYSVLQGLVHGLVPSSLSASGDVHGASNIANSSARGSERRLRMMSGGLPKSMLGPAEHHRNTAGSSMHGNWLQRVSAVPRSSSYDGIMTGMNRLANQERMSTFSASPLRDGQAVITAQSLSNVSNDRDGPSRTSSKTRAAFRSVHPTQ